MKSSEKRLKNTNSSKENDQIFQQMYKLLFNESEDAALVYKITPNGISNFLDVNKAAMKYLGYTKRELLHLTPNEINFVDKSKIHLSIIT